MKKGLLYFVGLVLAVLLTSFYRLSAQDPAPIAEMVIQNIRDTILLDGYSEDAYPDSFQLKTVLTFTAGKYSGGINGNDHSVWIKMGWRNEGIYIFARVKDDKDYGKMDWGQDGIEMKINPDTSNDGPTHLWKSDAWEIGIARDVDTVFRYYNPTVEGSVNCKNGGIVSSGPLLDLVPALSFKVINQVGIYTIEALIPWTFVLPPDTVEGVPNWPATDISAWRNKSWGFDIHAADNDASYNNSDRDHCLIWDGDGDPSSTDADKANVNTSLLGYITFGLPTNTSVTPVQKEIGIQVFPNPTRDFIQFNNLEGARSIVIYNCLGMMVKSIKVDSQNENIQVGDLPNRNIYFYQINYYSKNLPFVGKFLIN
jgi:hypothetical protein